MLLVAWLCATLAACGGGGSGTPADAGASPQVQVLGEPADQTVVDGNSAVLAVLAQAAGPIGYQWRRNGTPIPGATGPVYVTPALGIADSGTEFSVVLSSGTASRTQAATVTVQALPPRITSGPQSQTVGIGQAVQLVAQVEGSAPMSYRWQRDGVDIPGATQATLVLPPATAADNGARYRVIARNAAAEVPSEEATLTVGAGPVALRLTAFTLASRGQSVVLSASLGGTPPYTYQWLRNGEVVAGAGGTSVSADISLVTPVLTDGDDGVRYVLALGSSLGSGRSPEAVIRVVTPAPLAAGEAHSLVVSRDGQTVWAWGDNAHGQLGTGDVLLAASPRVVPALADVVAVAAGAAHSLALKRDGTVMAWGRNDHGAVGDGTRIDRRVPARVPGIDGVIAIAAAAGRSFALRADGTLWAWGENESGALGLGHRNDAPAPRRVGDGTAGFQAIVGLAAGTRQTLALRVDGRVFAMGEVPQGDAAPVLQLQPQAVQGVGQIATVAAGDGFALAIDIHGAVWAWGGNASGQLGVGDALGRAAPTRAGVDGGRLVLPPALRVVAGRGFSALLGVDDGAWTWGSNTTGQLGRAGAAGAAVPARLALQGSIVALAAGSAHALAIRSDGSVLAWGDNPSGQLGLGGTSTVPRDAPAQVPGLSVR